MFPDVVILAGGLGKRLQAVTGGRQKVLAEIDGRPFLEILIDYVASQGGRRFILCVGHGGHEVAGHFINKYRDREIVFSVEESPLGTGGAIKQGARHVTTERFLAMNGDCFCVIDYRHLAGFHQDAHAKATLAVTLMPEPQDYGTIEIAQGKTIEAFKEKQPLAVPAFINTGTYCFDRDVFSLVPTPDKFSIEYDFFPYLVGKGFYAFEVENRFIDIGTPERYSWAQQHLETLRGVKRKGKKGDTLKCPLLGGVMDFNKTTAIRDGQEAAKSSYKVPFGTVSITPYAQQLIHEAIERRWLTKGRYVKEFEEKFAALFGVKYGVAVSSGTDADAIACAVLYDFGAERGDEIIVPALTFVATGNAVLQAGFKPVFVDVRRQTLNIDWRKIEAAITPRTRAIMPVHLMGKPAAMDEIMGVAQKHKLYVIEDAAEAHGAEYKGRKIGAIGDMACFSLYAAHIITTIEGGMLITDNEQMAGAARSLRNHGIDGKFQFRRIGFSAKMNEIEAAVGLGNIQIFRDILEKRRANVRHLIKGFKKFDDYFWYLREDKDEVLGPHAFSIILKPGLNFTKNEFVTYLEKQGVDSRNLFYAIPTQTASYQFMGHKKGDFPESEYCSDHGTHIGCHQDVALEQMGHIINTVAEFLKSKGHRV